MQGCVHGCMNLTKKFVSLSDGPHESIEQVIVFRWTNICPSASDNTVHARASATASRHPTRLTATILKMDAVMRPKCRTKNNTSANKYVYIVSACKAVICSNQQKLYLSATFNRFVFFMRTVGIYSVKMYIFLALEFTLL